MATNPTPEVLAALRAAAITTGVPLSLLWGVAFIESRFNPRAVSPAGAQGLLQLMPATQQLYKVTDPFDATQSARAGARFLARLAKGTDWNVPAMLSAYNWGPTRYARAITEGRPIPAQVQKYARDVQAAQHYYRIQAPKPLGSRIERIDKAIRALAALNPAYAPATAALKAWQPFFAAHSGDTDTSAVLSPAVKEHWQAYARAYARAPLTDNTTPLPEYVEPDFWAEAVRSLDAAAEQIKQAAGRATIGLGAGLFFLAVFWFAVSERRLSTAAD
jgi:hypothetical protein